MARILHIDTSGPAAIVMLAVDGKPLSQQSSEGERDHAGRLNALVEEVLAAADMRLKDVDAIAICNGPGSYTGLRIGLATAKGYCYVTDKPLILHSRLKLMLLELAAQGIDNEADRLAILPARAGEYYIAAEGAYRASPRHITTEELLEHFSNNSSLYIIGGFGPDLGGLASKMIVSHQLLNISVWALGTYESFLINHFADIAYCEPEYLKSVYTTVSRADR